MLYNKLQASEASLSEDDIFNISRLGLGLWYKEEANVAHSFVHIL